MSQNQQREQLGSRIGFLLLAAGCAIGLGNVWRFPYIAGAYGGALFVFIYIGFLLAVGVPILVMEFSVGRAAQRNLGAALQKLEPKGSRWHTFGPLSLIGSYLLMMFYTTVAGWMLAYCWSMLKGDLSGLTPEQVGGFFGGLISDPTSSCLWMGVAVIFCFTVCGMGLRRGVERVVKFMMVGLFALMIALVVRAVTLPGGEAGISFYLMPDPEKLTGGLWAAVTAAMGQAFFTLGLGVGSMTIFGSYIDKSRSLTGEALYIVLLDTVVALMAGLIIFPACFAFGVNPGSGPGLVFVTLPNIFNSMPFGRFWGSLFFVFMSFAALSTVIAVFENIVSYCMDVWGWTRKKASTALRCSSSPCPARSASTSCPVSSLSGKVPPCWIWKTSSSAITCCPSAPCSSSPSAATDGAGAGTISSPKPIRDREPASPTGSSRISSTSCPACWSFFSFRGM